VFAGISLLGLDLFHSPSLFGREWPKLLRAHAIEAYGRPAAPDTPEPKLRAQVEGLIAQAAAVEGTLRGNAGVGQIFEFRVAGSRGAARLRGLHDPPPSSNRKLVERQAAQRSLRGSRRLHARRTSVR
jgi:hypothetical protein